MLHNRFQKVRKWGVAAASVALLACPVASSAHAVTVPYAEDFNGGTSAFVTSVGTGTVAWTDDGSINTLRFTQTTQGSGQANAAIVSVPDGLGADDLSPSQYFLISGTIKFDSYTTSATNGIDLGINLFGDAGFADAYRADFNPTKQTFRLAAGSPTNTDYTVSVVSTPFSFSMSETYTLTLKGWYTGLGTLNMEFTLTDPNLATAVITATDPTPLIGTNFGFRTRTGSSVTATNTVTQFDNFSISVVPEPSAIVLLSMGGFVGIAVARRRASYK